MYTYLRSNLYSLSAMQNSIERSKRNNHNRNHIRNHYHNNNRHFKSSQYKTMTMNISSNNSNSPELSNKNESSDISTHSFSIDPTQFSIAGDHTKRSRYYASQRN